MAQQVGDLWPFSSGTSSLGAEVTNGGFTGEVRPFGHLHVNSGVFHALNGSSGVIRYSGTSLEFSNDGGLSWNILDVTTPSITSLSDDVGTQTTDQIIQLTTSNGVLSETVDGSTINFDVTIRGVNGITATHPSEGVTLIDSASLSGLITLQGAYNGGHTISTSLAEGGPVAITGTDQSALRLAVSEGQGVHLELSGVIMAPTLFTNQGGILLAKHAYNLNNPFLATATEEELKASSPGLPTMWVNMGGSGLAAVRVGSGIVQFFNTALSAAIDTTGFNINFPAAGQTNLDSFYRGVPQSGIRFNVDGLYRVNYSASVTKTNGNLLQQVNTEIRVNDEWGRTFRILGGSSFAQVRDTVANTNTANGQAVFDVNAGEIVNIFVATQSTPIEPNIILLNARSCNVVIEYLGPQRGRSTIRQEIVP